MRPSRIALSLLALVPVILGADSARVVKPAPDTLVVGSATSVTGIYVDETGNAVDGEIDILANGVDMGPVRTVGGVWSYPSVPLQLGLNIFTGSTLRLTPEGASSGSLAPFLLEQRNDLVARGRQDVFLDFADPEFDGLMREIALATLEPDPAPERLDAFAALVREEIGRYLDLVYSGNDVVRVDAMGPEVQRIHFDSTTLAPGLFGESPLDFLNERKDDVSTIYITTFKTTVVDENLLLIATPALESDSLEQRARDVATLIGRTAAHELGHSLGLVVATERGLKGCGGSHNCPAYDLRLPLANRFEDGHFIMDPGEQSALFARAGFANRIERAPRLPVFNSYNKSYIGHIHP